MGFLCNAPNPPTQTTTTESTPELPVPYQQALYSLIGKSSQIADSPYQTYPGQQRAGFTGAQNQAFDLTQNQVGSYAPQLAIASQTTPQANMQAYMNPFQQAVTDINQRNTVRNYQMTTAPQLNAAAVGAGGFGGTRHALLQAESARNLNQSLNDMQQQDSYANWAQAQQAFNADRLNAANTANLAQQLPLRDAAALSAIGLQQQQEQQANLDVSRSNFERQQQYPYQQAAFMSNIIRGLPFNSLTSTNTQTAGPGAQQPSPLSQVAGTGLAALGFLGGTGAFGQNGYLKFQKGGAVKGFAGGGGIRSVLTGILKDVLIDRAEANDFENMFKFAEGGSVEGSQANILSRMPTADLIRILNSQSIMSGDYSPVLVRKELEKRPDKPRSAISDLVKRLYGGEGNPSANPGIPMMDVVDPSVAQSAVRSYVPSGEPPFTEAGAQVNPYTPGGEPPFGDEGSQVYVPGGEPPFSETRGAGPYGGLITTKAAQRPVVQTPLVQSFTPGGEPPFTETVDATTPTPTTNSGSAPQQAQPASSPTEGFWDRMAIPIIAAGAQMMDATPGKTPLQMGGVGIQAGLKQYQLQKEAARKDKLTELEGRKVAAEEKSVDIKGKEADAIKAYREAVVKIQQKELELKALEQEDPSSPKYKKLVAEIDTLRAHAKMYAAYADRAGQRDEEIVGTPFEGTNGASMVITRAGKVIPLKDEQGNAVPFKRMKATPSMEERERLAGADYAKWLTSQIAPPTKQERAEMLEEIRQAHGLTKTAVSDTAGIPPQAVDMLKKNPKLRDAFDAKYGKGKAALILGE